VGICPLPFENCSSSSRARPIQLAGVILMGGWRKAPAGTTRPSPRIAASVRVRVSTIDPETDLTTGKRFFRSIEETTANLSPGGAFVRSWEPLEPGRRVLIDLEFPDGHHLELVARVAWTQRELRFSPATSLDAPGFGVQFEGATRAELARIDRYLAGLEKRPAEAKQPLPSAPVLRP